jgi:predicted  nucleic acid-binding Zn-ribbon protein
MEPKEKTVKALRSAKVKTPKKLAAKKTQFEQAMAAARDEVYAHYKRGAGLTLLQIMDIYNAHAGKFSAR